jgi:formyltetrahydrofolate-dependent phosphoribosylglycinamide formyltransferase
MATGEVVARPFGRAIRLGVLISGGGRTLGNLAAKVAAGELNAEIALVIASSAHCGGLEIAKIAGLRSEVVDRKAFDSVEKFSAALFNKLREANVDLAALAGFLCLIQIPEDYRLRVMNIHPALIPAFCGKDFHGHKVHKAVIERGVKVSGCTVHFADNEYDNGPIILQRTVPVLDDDTPDTLAARVFQEECVAYPEAIRRYAQGKLRVVGRRVLTDG